jgi:glycosyltransferase involved in cell wall biosynthesis
MTSSTNVALVIPCYNEERRLHLDVFVRELSENPNLSLLFVNDGSEDNTQKVIQKICDSNPARTLSLSLNKNMGKGEAVRTGMLYLLKTGSYNPIGFWDADLAVPLSEVLDFVDIFRTNPEVRVVIGSRVHLAGRLIERINFRHYLGRLFATIMCLTFGFTIYDTQCGAKLFDRDVLIPVVEDPFHSKWIFDVELLMRISLLPSLKIKNNWLYEVPVKEWLNISGTKRNISAYTNAFFDYIHLVRKYLHRK